MKRRDRWIPIAIFGVTLVVLLWVGLSYLAVRLVDCEPGSFYSLKRGRCVGGLEFDVGGSWW
jgi:hypothetical protein